MLKPVARVHKYNSSQHMYNYILTYSLNSCHLIQAYLLIQHTCSTFLNDHTIGWQKINPLSHPDATLAPQARQAKASGENLNYMTQVPQARQARASGENLNCMTLAKQARQVKQSGEILNYSMSHESDILVRSLVLLVALVLRHISLFCCNIQKTPA